MDGVGFRVGAVNWARTWRLDMAGPVAQPVEPLALVLGLALTLLIPACSPVDDGGRDRRGDEDGDVGWAFATQGSTTLNVVRVTECD